MPPVAAATAGAVCISSSAVLMKLASTASPSVTAFGRCAFALPVLGALALRERRHGGRPFAGGGGRPRAGGRLLAAQDEDHPPRVGRVDRQIAVEVAVAGRDGEATV